VLPYYVNVCVFNTPSFIYYVLNILILRNGKFDCYIRFTFQFHGQLYPQLILQHFWFKDGILLPEFNSKNYTKPFISSNDNGLYTCAVNDSSQALTSLEFNVTVWGKRFNIDFIVSYVR